LVDSKLKTTPALNQFSRDLTEMAKRESWNRLWQRRRKTAFDTDFESSNQKQSLPGWRTGVGKTVIVEALASKWQVKRFLKHMRGKRLMMLDLPGMVAGSKYRGEFEERIKKIISEVREDGEVLLFIDEIHTIIGAGGAEGAIDASNILKPSLTRENYKLLVRLQ
jgi:ATP-dependent Clp protease ATP-binding subunit ClpC